MFAHKKIYLAVAGCVALSPAFAAEDAAEASSSINLAPVVVTATRVEQNSFDLPVSIDAVSGETVRDGQLQVNLSETANRVPGVVVNNRNNPAQDLAVQVRGFGARSAFGVRGVRLYADGIPMTMPDGQGQTGTFNLDTAKSIEYLRGPFSALYGNSSGGVVQIFTQDGPDDLTLQGGLTLGSYDTQRASIGVAGDSNDFNYVVNASTYRSDGYRDQSNTRRDSLHAKFGLKFNEFTKLTVVATGLNQPDNQDPQGLTAAQMAENRKQANPNSLKFDTRVSRRHEQVGVTLEHLVTPDDTLRLMAYYGTRQNEQFQSISIAAQRDDRNGGGVATIDRDFGGIDLRWTHKGKLGNAPYNLTAGVNYDRMEDDRKGYENFTSNAVFGTLPANRDCGNVASNITCGVKGNLRRDETNIAYNFDQYLQAAMDLTPRWNISAGVRHSRVSFENKDRFIGNFYTEVPTARVNPDDSGSVSFSETTPVIGAIFKVTETFNLYANAGKSFETPTFVEMAYQTTGAGLNMSLKPAKSKQYEVGAKWMLGDSTLLNASIFKINTDDEIVVLQQSGGRTIYQNVDTSERKGFELSMDTRFSHGLSAYLAYSYLDAEFTSDFTACRPFSGTQTTCLPTVAQSLTNSGGELIKSGAEIPGTYKHTLFGEVAWRHQPTGFATAIEAKANSKTFVAFKPEYGAAEGYTTVAWRGGFTQKHNGWKFNEFVRVENLFDKEYVGSVRVGDLNGSYYEPAPGRNWMLGVNANYQF